MVDRINSVDIKSAVGLNILKGVTSLSVSSQKEYLGIQKLGSLKEDLRVQQSPPESEIDISWILGKNSSDPFFDFKNNEGIMSINSIADFRIRDPLGYLFFQHVFLTNYSVNCSVGQPIEASASFVCLPPKRISQTNFAPDENQYFPSLPSKVFLKGEGPETEQLEALSIQSFELSFSVEREPQKHLGQMLYDHRRPLLPINGQVSITFIKQQDFDNHLYKDEVIALLPNNSIDLIIGGCDGEHFEYKISNANLESLSESCDLDGNVEYSAEYIFSIGNKQNQGIEFTRKT